MKIEVLVEDTSSSPSYRSEHGLSLYIETKNNKILFDTGASDLFLENAKKFKEIGPNCTGIESYHILKDILGDQIQYLSTGSVVEI